MRVMPEGSHARIEMDWPLPPIFEMLQQGGNLANEEMARTFNCGVGMAVIVSSTDVEPVTNRLEGAGEGVFRIGEVGSGERGCTITGPGGSWSTTHNA